MDQIFRHKVIKQLIKETKIVEYQNKLYIQTPFLCLTGEYQKTYVEYYKLKVSKLLDYNILTNFNTGLKVHLEYVYGIYPKEVKDGNLNEFCEITYIRSTYYNLLFFYPEVRDHILFHYPTFYRGRDYTLSQMLKKLKEMQLYSY